MEATLTPTLSTMPAHARVWIYKSAAPFTADQLATIRTRGAAFTGSWNSHGDAVVSACEALHDHFVVLAADLHDMVICGGAIDGSVQFIKKLEAELGVPLTDRMVVLYEQGGAVRSCRVPEVEKLVKNGTLGPDTTVFDDLVATKADLDGRFRTPLRNSWMARYL
ncbi:MAG: hypothetical protein IT230_07945 [Flavobacteriales bacterium]|nr:hypothetical protein [Flavobacteriales bacterium]